mgnify:CR=1 FL=1|jgi:hypothetical protein
MEMANLSSVSESKECRQLEILKDRSYLKVGVLDFIFLVFGFQEVRFNL